MSFRTIGELCRDVIAEAELAARGHDGGHKLTAGCPSGGADNPPIAVTAGGQTGGDILPVGEVAPAKLKLVADTGRRSAILPPRKGHFAPALRRPVLVVVGGQDFTVSW
jgi:hypothetical protein